MLCQEARRRRRRRAPPAVVVAYASQTAPSAAASVHRVGLLVLGLRMASSAAARSSRRVEFPAGEEWGSVRCRRRSNCSCVRRAWESKAAEL